MYCTASAFLLGIVLCGWGLGFGVVWPKKDDDCPEEDDRRDGERPLEESRRNIQRENHTQESQQCSPTKSHRF